MRSIQYRTMNKGQFIHHIQKSIYSFFVHHFWTNTCHVSDSLSKGAQSKELHNIQIVKCNSHSCQEMKWNPLFFCLPLRNNSNFPWCRLYWVIRSGILLVCSTSPPHVPADIKEMNHYTFENVGMSTFERPIRMIKLHQVDFVLNELYRFKMACHCIITKINIASKKVLKKKEWIDKNLY